MRFINVFNKPQNESVVNEASEKVDGQRIDAPKPPISDGEMYNDLLTMNMFANYYPHVFPDQYMFR